MALAEGLQWPARERGKEKQHNVRHTYFKVHMDCFSAPNGCTFDKLKKAYHASA